MRDLARALTRTPLWPSPLEVQASAWCAAQWASRAALDSASSGPGGCAWEGGPHDGIGQAAAPATPGVGFATARCTQIYECDNELLELKEQGTLTIDIKAGEGSNDLDIRLYKSDESGTAPGGPNPVTGTPEPIAEDIREEKDAKITVKNLKPGFYVAQVAFFNATQGMSNGTATFTSSAAAMTPVAPAAPATPVVPQQTSPTTADNKAAEAKRKQKLAACKEKARKIKNKKKRAKAQKRLREEAREEELTSPNGRACGRMTGERSARALTSGK